MQRIGKIDILPDDIIVGNRQNRYRNKAQYPVSKDANGKTVCGFYTGRSHRIAECDDCMLQPEIFNNIKSAFCSWADKFNITAYDEKTGKGILRHLYLRIAEATDQIMVCIIINGTKLPYSDELISDLLSVSDKIKSIQININRQNTNVIMGDICKTLWGDDYITDILCGVKVRLSAQSFYQVNREMAEKLYSVAFEFAEPQGKTVLDLFCGAGTIGLSMAVKAKSIIGVEIVPEAVKDAEYNAQINAIDNARFICSDAATAAAQLNAEGECPDVVILDPPRKGCDAELIKTVAKDFRPERVVYVSCNDATLARDCLIFSELGYSVKKVVPVDLFPRTGHVETVVLMSRIK